MFRNAKHLGRWLAIAVAVGLACCAVALAAKPPKPVTPAYTIMPFMVAPPPEFQSQGSWVYDLNERGRAVGYEEFRKELADGSYAELYWGLHLNTASGECTWVPNAHFATGINNFNQIVGVTASGGTFWRSPADAVPVSLPPLSGDTRSAPYAINDAGMVVGNSLNVDGEVILTRGVVWRVVVGETVSVQGPVPLPLLEGDPQAWAIALSELSNGSFHVTGYSQRDDAFEAIVWTVALDGNGTFTPGQAVSLVENNAYSSGHGININGDVCGGLGGYPMPFLAPAGQTAQLLPVPRDTTAGVAMSINNLGDIVGYLEIYTKLGRGGDYAYLWKDGSPIDLTKQIDPAAGWARLWIASVINDAGMIGGSGPRDIQWRGFVLIPNAPWDVGCAQTHQSAIAANIVVRFTHLTKTRPVS